LVGRRACASLRAPRRRHFGISSCRAFIAGGCSRSRSSAHRSISTAAATSQRGAAGLMVEAGRLVRGRPLAGRMHVSGEMARGRRATRDGKAGTARKQRESEGAAQAGDAQMADDGDRGARTSGLTLRTVQRACVRKTCRHHLPLRMDSPDDMSDGARFPPLVAETAPSRGRHIRGNQHFGVRCHGYGCRLCFTMLLSGALRTRARAGRPQRRVRVIAGACPI
jgi:hypothetical protein